jgi:hypothetical protein
MTLASLRWAFLLSLLAFLIMLVVSLGLTNLYGAHEKVRALKAVDQGLASDMNHLKVEGDLIAQNEQLKQYVVDNDSPKILSLLTEEKDRRSIGLMTATNKDGIIITRTRSNSSRGDNTFLVSPQGRAVAEGKEPVSIEMSSFDNTQVVMTTGRLLKTSTTTIGSLFANNLLDDSYSTAFKKKYLFDGVQVAFYTHDYGIYGSSIQELTERSLVQSYFHVDSDWIKHGKTGDIVRFDSGIYYRVENVEFPGLEHSPGGVLVFIPYYGYALPVRALIIVLTLALFTAIVVRSHRRLKKDQRNRYYYWSIITALVILIAFIYIINHAAFVKYLAIKKIPYVLYNSTLRLQPESGVYGQDFGRTVSVLINTGDETINTVSVRISYDPSMIKVQDIDTEHSICTNYLDKAIDPANREIRLTCIIVAPGFSGSQGNVGDIVFQPLKTGTFNFGFKKDTQVLANDGLGTNVLRMANDGNYRIIPSNAARELPPLVSTTTLASTLNDRLPIVFSPTHPNSSRWYNSSSIDFVWTPVGTVNYLYAFDQATSTVPVNGVPITGNKVTVKAPSDGEFYFHVAPLFGTTLGPTRHYKVSIDTEPPVDVQIRASDDDVKVGDVVRFEFSGRDEYSGLQSSMYIDINSGTFLPVGRQTYIPFVDIGDVPVRLRVYDKAGNYAEREKIIHTSGTILQNILRSR